MPLSDSQRSLAYAERRKARGHTRVAVWIPNTAAARAELQHCADKLCGEPDPVPLADEAKGTAWWRCQRDGTCRLNVGLVGAELWRVEWWPGGPIAWLWYVGGPAEAGEPWRPDMIGRATSQQNALELATRAVIEHPDVTGHQRASLARRMDRETSIGPEEEIRAAEPDDHLEGDRTRRRDRALKRRRTSP